MKSEPINPAALGAPHGYSHGMLAPRGGRLLFVAGQIAWDAANRIVCPDFPGQFGKALANVVEVVRGAGGAPDDVVRLTIFVADRSLYLADLAAVGQRYREVMGRHYPAMTLVEVGALLHPESLVEIEATAVLPE